MLRYSACLLCLLMATPADARSARAKGRPHHAKALAHKAAAANKPIDLRPAPVKLAATGRPPAAAAAPAAIEVLIERHAAEHGVPVALVHRVIMRESRYNPRAHNRAYWGLMQIRHDTARSMGYRGPASGLLDADTNLTYAIPYLANAYMVAGGDQNRAVSLYARGFYYEAKRKNLLGHLQTARSTAATRAAANN